ncbi:diaminopimelate epimerase [Mongoliitalea daihaiensis]|uniref:diaminopimelate epimerase n=1 Tax=Mongoliitalea daihaiensis TaxID=2782006 RepID=UPI001F1CCAEC|nr:diaminopimelate epimerase [Mongoliitalea daihaiensis]UJP65711.1 diaminopimelate epimerase [Mongoliitalea daihaiensis]
MEILFYKYQGTGNDFVMIDDRESTFPIDNLALVRSLCDRKFGIGADGLIAVRTHDSFDFEMIYFNADGSQSMCGNGARCAVAFAHFLGIIGKKTSFLAIDGPHAAWINNPAWVALEMSPVKSLEIKDNDHFVNTGSPHHVQFVEHIHDFPVVDTGAKIRYDQSYAPNGTNVNFLSPISTEEIYVRTYERGVENETLSCGTGVTACALVFGKAVGIEKVFIQTLGGKLEVSFTSREDGSFDNIILSGPAEQVYQGKIVKEI